MANEYLNFSLDTLNFKLKEAEDELHNLSMDLFTLNPRVGELTKEIADIREAIKSKEDK